MNVLELGLELLKDLRKLIAKRKFLEKVKRVVGGPLRGRDRFKTRVFHRRVCGMNKPGEVRVRPGRIPRPVGRRGGETRGF